MPDGEREPLVARVLDEARAAARLSHPHIVTVHDAGVSPDGAYIAMELLRGDLSQMLRSGWSQRRQAALIVRRVADALSYAHGKAWCTAMSPGNIFMVGRTRPVVLDFGIAQSLHQAEAIGGPALGSPYYAAPEQFDGRSTIRAPMSTRSAWCSTSCCAASGPSWAARWREIRARCAPGGPAIPARSIPACRTSWPRSR